MQINKAVVTGATGVIGSALVKMLHERGIMTYALCRPSSPNSKNIKKFAEIIESDLSCYDSAIKIIKQADVFFHLGWDCKSRQERYNPFSQSLNINYTLKAVEAAYVMRCAVFVGAGSQAEYGYVNGALKPETPANPECAYGMAKLSAGQLSRLLCQQKQIRHVWTRILSVYGAYDREDYFINYVFYSLRKGEKPKLTKCEQIWDYMYCDDAARAFILLAEKGDGYYPLGSGEARKLREYAEDIKSIVNPGAEIGYGELPYGENQIMYLCADITALKNDTGFTPAFTFIEGIKRMMQI
jgi:nucleoside-diphosphate-sugar epimerase